MWMYCKKKNEENSIGFHGDMSSGKAFDDSEAFTGLAYDFDEGEENTPS